MQSDKVAILTHTYELIILPIRFAENNYIFVQDSQKLVVQVKSDSNYVMNH